MENKKEEISDATQEAVALVKQYVPPDPAKIQAAQAAGRLSEPSHPPITELDVRNATPPPRFEVKAPEVAPNVLIVLMPASSLAVSSTMGGSPTLI